MSRALAISAIAAIILGVLGGIAQGASSHRTKIEIVYEPQANGDYRLFLFGSDRSLVCEEKPIQIVNQGDAMNPVVLECKH